MIFMRSVSPLIILKARLGIFSRFASNWIRAALAMPFSGVAVTEILRRDLPSGVCAQPLISLRDALGVSLIVSRTGSDIDIQCKIERGSAVGEGADGDVIDAGFSNGADGFECDTAGGFGDDFAPGERDGFF